MSQKKGGEHYRLWSELRRRLDDGNQWRIYLNSNGDGLSHAELYEAMGKDRRSRFIAQNAAIEQEFLDVEKRLREAGIINAKSAVLDDGARQRSEMASSGHSKSLESSLMSSLNRIKALEQENRALHQELEKRNIIFDLLANGRVPR